MAKSLRAAGDKFQISRKFATVDNKGQAEEGLLTISSAAMNNNSYTQIEVKGIMVHYQNYEFGNRFLTDEELKTEYVNKGNPDWNTY